MLFLTNKEKITNLILNENEQTRKEKNLSGLRIGFWEGCII